MCLMKDRLPKREHVAILGDSDFPDRQLVYDYIAAFYEGIEHPDPPHIITGYSMHGVETWVREIARTYSCPCTCIPFPVSGASIQDKHFLRDTEIVGLADRLVVFWMGRTGVTDGMVQDVYQHNPDMAIRIARESSKPTELIMVGGLRLATASPSCAT